MRIHGSLVLLLLITSNANSQELNVTLRTRTPSAADPKVFDLNLKKQTWDPKQTAIIVCDMWDRHHCPTAEKRVVELCPRMNDMLESARKRGILIIHAPSSCMEAYKDHPGRKLAQSAPAAKELPIDIAKWCYKIPSEEKGEYPIDQTDSCDCEKEGIAAHEKAMAAEGRNPKAPWKKQNPLLTIRDEDPISDSGVEIWNLLTARGINNVMLLGVHTNMCVLGRPFGLRQMAKNGKNTALVRDLTDTMYNPEKRPHVSHFKGTELIIEHIEKYVCATITSDQIAVGSMFRFAGDSGK